MNSCTACGHDSEDMVTECVNCGARLRAEGADSPAAAVSPEGAPDPPGGDGGQEGGGAAADGGQLFALLMRPGDTARDVAAMDPEALLRTVAYMRKKKFTAGTVDPNLTDEQAAEAILIYARSIPPDTRAGDLKRVRSPKMASWGLWVKWLLAHGGADLITGVPLFILARMLEADPVALTDSYIYWAWWTLVLGTMQWLVLRRWAIPWRAWLAATAAGVLLYLIAFGLASNLAPNGIAPGIWVETVKNVVLGTAIGTGQWVVLRRRFSRAGWWILVYGVAWALAGLVGQASECLLAVGLLVLAAVTGYALVWLARGAVGEDADQVAEEPAPVADPGPADPARTREAVPDETRTGEQQAGRKKAGGRSGCLSLIPKTPLQVARAILFLLVCVSLCGPWYIDDFGDVASGLVLAMDLAGWTCGLALIPYALLFQLWLLVILIPAGRAAKGAYRVIVWAYRAMLLLALLIVSANFWDTPPGWQDVGSGHWGPALFVISVALALLVELVTGVVGLYAASRVTEGDINETKDDQLAREDGA